MIFFLNNKIDTKLNFLPLFKVRKLSGSQNYNNSLKRLSKKTVDRKPSKRRRSIRPVSLIQKERPSPFENKNHPHRLNWENLKVSRSTNDDDYEDGRDGGCLDAAPVGSPPDPRRSRRIQLQVPPLSLLPRLLLSFHPLTGTCSLVPLPLPSSVLDFVTVASSGGRMRRI